MATENKEEKHILDLAFSKRISDTYGQYFTDKLINDLSEKMTEIDNTQLTVLPDFYNKLLGIEKHKFIISYRDKYANCVRVEGIEGYKHLGMRQNKDVFGLVIDMRDYGWAETEEQENTREIIAKRIRK